MVPVTRATKDVHLGAKSDEMWYMYNLQALHWDMTKMASSGLPWLGILGALERHTSSSCEAQILGKETAYPIA
jgi:hypothetical protein